MKSNSLTDFIDKNPNWKDLLSDEHGDFSHRIKNSTRPGEENLWIFSYNQIRSKWSRPENKYARGIILEIKDGHVTKVVRRAFDKFFNSGEGYADKIDWSAPGLFASLKMDGCLQADTLIETPDGFKAIQDLCESSYRGLVKAKDLETGQPCWTLVEAVSIQADNDDWYEIVLSDGQCLYLTGNHRVWLPELKCWRQARDLEGTEKVDVL